MKIKISKESTFCCHSRKHEQVRTKLSHGWRQLQMYCHVRYFNISLFLDLHSPWTQT